MKKIGWDKGLLKKVPERAIFIVWCMLDHVVGIIVGYDQSLKMEKICLSRFVPKCPKFCRIFIIIIFLE